MANKNFWQMILEAGLTAFANNKTKITEVATKAAVNAVQKPVEPIKAEVKPSNSLTVEQWATSCGRYVDRAKSPELTDEVKKNAEDLCVRVNALLNELGWTKKLDIASGFRTSGSNAAIAGAAKKSSHMIGKAVDLLDDKEQSLAKLVESRPDLLRKHGLMMEDKSNTVGKNTNWCHLDTHPRADRPSRTFKP